MNIHSEYNINHYPVVSVSLTSVHTVLPAIKALLKPNLHVRVPPGSININPHSPRCEGIINIKKTCVYSL